MFDHVVSNEHGKCIYFISPVEVVYPQLCSVD